MSAKKVNETKIPQQDENQDSGFLSGPCDLLSGEIDTRASFDVDVPSDSLQQKSELDSGVVCISECLENVQLCDLTESHPQITLQQVKPQDLPPISILFEPDQDGDTQLHIASIHGYEKSVSLLIRVCPEKAWLDVPNDYGHTALHLAVMSGSEVVTRMLVLAGASLAVRDRTGETPVHKATAAKNLKCLQALLAPVPEEPHRTLTAVLNQKNYNGQTCVHIAASAGHIEALQMLMFYGADINASESLAGWTALHVAARRGDVPLAKWLVARGAAGRPRDHAGRTPRRLAARGPAAAALPAADSDDDSDSDDDMYDSDSESLFEKLRDSLNPINVA